MANIIDNYEVSFGGSLTYANAVKQTSNNRIYFTTDSYGSILVNGKLYGTSNSNYLSKPTTGDLKKYIDEVASGAISSGTSAEAEKLTCGTKGSTSKPVYFNDGIPVAITSLDNTLLPINNIDTTTHILPYYTIDTNDNKSKSTSFAFNLNLTNKKIGLTLSNIPELVDKKYVDKSISDLIGSAPDTLNTLQEIGEWISNDENVTSQILNDISKIKTDIEDNEYVCANALNTLNTYISTLIPIGNFVSSYYNSSVGTTGNPIYLNTNGIPKPVTSINNSLINKSNGSSSLSWNEEITLATIAGQAIKAKLPSNPNTDTKVTNAANHYKATTATVTLKPTTYSNFNEDGKKGDGEYYKVVTNILIDDAKHIINTESVMIKPASSSNAGLMTSDDKEKLNNLPSSVVSTSEFESLSSIVEELYDAFTWK